MKSILLAFVLTIAACGEVHSGGPDPDKIIEGQIIRSATANCEDHDGLDRLILRWRGEVRSYIAACDDGAVFVIEELDE